MAERHCVIAGLRVDVQVDDTELTTSVADRYAPFARSVDACGDVPLLFRLDVVQPFASLSDAREVLRFDHDDCVISHEQGAECWSVTLRSPADDVPLAQMQVAADYASARCWLSGSVERRAYAFNNFMMQLFAFAAMDRQTLLLHASTVSAAGRGYLFLGRSGTGKSTHSRLWLENVEGAELINDDNPAVAVRGGEVMVYGTPWSGKTPCYRDVAWPVGAIVRLHQASRNVIRRHRGVAAYAALLPSCSALRWNASRYRAMTDAVADVVSRVPIYELDCLPDAAAALLCHSAVGRMQG